MNKDKAKDLFLLIGDEIMRNYPKASSKPLDIANNTRDFFLSIYKAQSVLPFIRFSVDPPVNIFVPGDSQELVLGLQSLCDDAINGTNIFEWFENNPHERIMGSLQGDTFMRYSIHATPNDNIVQAVFRISWTEDVQSTPINQMGYSPEQLNGIDKIIPN